MPGLAVLHLVDCSLLVPPVTGPDGRSRYGLLETLRAYAAGLLGRSGERNEAAAALAGYAVRVAEEAAAAMETTSYELAGARRLDAEDATMRQVLAWAMEHDPDTAVRLAVALRQWWFLRGRLAGPHDLLRQAADRAVVGSDGWCAVQKFLGYSAISSADLAGALRHFTALRDAAAVRGACQPLADGLSGRSTMLSNMGLAAEAAAEASRALEVSREICYPAGECLALVNLGIAAGVSGDRAGAVRLARQAGQTAADIPGWLVRVRGWILGEALIGAGDLAGAADVCAAGLALSRDMRDLWSEAIFLRRYWPSWTCAPGNPSAPLPGSARRCTLTSRPTSRST